MIDGFRLATIAPSLGGVETLVEQPAVMSYHVDDERRAGGAGIEDGLVRLAWDQDEEDNLADLARALT